MRKYLKYFYLLLLALFIAYLLLFVKTYNIENWLSKPLTQMNNASLIIMIIIYSFFMRNNNNN